MRLKTLLFWFIIAMAGRPVLANENTNTQTLFHQFSDRLYQIKVIEISSDESSSTGSGFQVTRQGHIATNYHVVSPIIQEPDAYMLIGIDMMGKRHTLTLLDIDIVNDLAIVLCEDAREPYLILDEQTLSQGTRIYALGNPYDLNMSIIEGTFNGLLEDQFYEQIFFSGALNPGMSGGPAIDGLGRVVGINVSGTLNEISFLVPVHFLIRLIETVGGEPHEIIDFDQRIETQLVANQDRLMADVMGADWEKQPYGDVSVPKIKRDYIKGWGGRDDKKDAKYSVLYSGYSMPNGVYVHDRVDVGTLSIKYYWIETDQLGSVQFYNMVETYFNDYKRPNRASRDDRTNYETHAGFLHHGGMNWKVLSAARNYVKYEGLYDYIFNMVSLEKPDRAFIASVSLAGFSKENCIQFTQTFVEQISWQN